ncbi:MAG: DUF2336 domain-containing protein [Rhodospirillaceae bacterium]|jgi:uncharacterized protein (DUF2336 family)|nr:DUF2336 domain-containing protein [Rhodospirillaceae bacterium]MBT4588054.1 DUF2336 domain-containing protein [Rhodospirillaceae bacterium]MBT4940847.1 DUF2336 domain-containing protein [Rhodospirillaceae bacterium]MBT5939716.1 DUF2336 domain-containing protein [Rhodospirillaceae bacterium]MBT7268156.1 DUF2336 domain-containing protein [Rhodospirillaceae bacterium]
MGSVQSLYLFKLARDKSSDGKKAFAKSISDVFLDHFPELTKRERRLMYEILQQSVHQAEMGLREKVSKRLAAEQGVPRELAKLLANDEIEVAFPILSMSDALLDDDLIEIIHNRSVEHQLAVTKRPMVSEQVSKAIVEHGEEDVIRSLLLNPNSKISRTTVEYLVEESKRLTSLQEPILRREDLDPALSQRMYGWVSSALQQYIVDNYELDAEFVRDIVDEATEEELSTKPKNADKPAPEKRLIDELEVDGQLDPGTMVRILEEGDVRLFIAMFQRYTGLTDKMVLEMLKDRDGTGLAIACKAAHLERPIFSSIYAHSYKANRNGVNIRRQEINKMLGRYDLMSKGAAEKVVSRWNDNVAYKDAIRELEL